jgi:ABC-type transport system involved in multi-copper enzyme maturation permease subunit
VNVLPVIRRELRAESRRAGAWWLRLQGGLAVIAIMTYAWTHRPFRDGDGGRLFDVMHVTLFFSAWFFVPLMTADVLSRERREGTLGLLFLTPLRSMDIVLAKGFVHTLRAASMGLAVAPVLMVPVLLGGVTGDQVLFSVTMNACVFCWATAAGLLASSFNRKLAPALVWALILSGLFLWLFLKAYGFFIWVGWHHFSPLTGVKVLGLQQAQQVNQVLENLTPRWEPLASFAPMPRSVWLAVCAALCVFSVLGLVLCLLLAARNVRRHWQEEPPSARRQAAARMLFTPRFATGFYQRWMRRKLERNPVGWIEQRTWSARLVTWTWLATLVSILGALASAPELLLRHFQDIFNLLALALAVSLGATAAGSFQRERETGVLELLLVSPLEPRRILAGRLRGVWEQFLPALTLLAGGWLYLSSGWQKQALWSNPFYFDAVSFVGMLVGFVAMPVIGSYCALRFRHHSGAIIATLVVGLFVPHAMPEAVQFAGLRLGSALGLELDFLMPQSAVEDAIRRWQGAGLTFLLQAALAARCWQRAVRELVQRRCLTRLFTVA